MFLKIDEVESNGTTYRYVRLVESYRRESDGQPTHRVLANFGDLPDSEVENLRAALEASRDDKKLVAAPSDGPEDAPRRRPKANLQYLDCALLGRLWARGGLGEMLEELMLTGQAEVAPAKIVEALALQRCLAPGSKLQSTRWFPRTALPELMGIAPEHFNNTRLHRVLEQLADIEDGLMERLAGRTDDSAPADCEAMFLDVTDAWFEGRGPELAEYGKTKEGLSRYKIGIALLCNGRGEPVRWRVVEGNAQDATTCRRFFEELAGFEWLDRTPIVVDRAMGKTAQLEEMLDRQIRFVTGLTRPELPTYAPGLPYGQLAELECRAEGDEETEADRARRWAIEHGFEEVRSSLYVREMGHRPLGAASEAELPEPGEDRTVYAMRMARRLESLYESGEAGSWAAAGRSLGMSKRLASKYRTLLELPESVQRRLLEGEAEGHTLRSLVGIVDQQAGAEARGEAFEQLLERPPPEPGTSFGPRGAEPETTHTVRAVAFFNPERWVTERRHAQQRLDDIDEWVEQFNAKLARPQSRRDADSVAAAVDRKLRDEQMLSLFDIQTSAEEVVLELDEQAWRRKRRFDGLGVLVAHPGVARGAAELCELYRAKNAVEQDFGVIKSDLEIRPIHHHRDSKVRAHVTVCMLALLLERTLEAEVPDGLTARRALEKLRGGRLNLMGPTEEGRGVYLLNEPTDEQRSIVEAFELDELLDETEVRETITPR